MLRVNTPRTGHDVSCPYKCLRLGVDVRSDADGVDALRFGSRVQAVFLVIQGGADEGGEERMRHERLGFEFGMELAAEKPGVFGRLDDFDVISVGRAAGDAEAGVRQSFFVVAIKFVAVAVALADFGFAVGLAGRSRVRVCRATRRGAWCRPFRRRRAVRAICK